MRIIPILERFLDKRDEKKRIKALSKFPWCYEDRHGRKWFNMDYCCEFGHLRKWC